MIFIHLEEGEKEREREEEKATNREFYVYNKIFLLPCFSFYYFCFANKGLNVPFRVEKVHETR